jgi:hypothetical protein
MIEEEKEAVIEKVNCDNFNPEQNKLYANLCKDIYEVFDKGMFRAQDDFDSAKLSHFAVSVMVRSFSAILLSYFHQADLLGEIKLLEDILQGMMDAIQKEVLEGIKILKNKQEKAH